MSYSFSLQIFYMQIKSINFDKMQNKQTKQVANKAILKIKQAFLNQFQKLSKLLHFSKTVYQQHPKLTFTVASLAFIAVGTIYGLISKQQSLLYFPEIGYGRSNSSNPKNMICPQNRGIDADNIELQTSDKVVLRGWHMKKDQSDRIIVYFQGNAGNIGTRLPFAQQLMDRTNSEVIMVAYRGYSDSDGSPSQKGIQKDAESILQKAIQISKESKKPLYVFGTSLGGAVTIYVSGTENVRQEINGVIVENTFTSTTDVLPYHAPFMRMFVPFIRLINRNSWPSIQRINKIKRPVLFIKCGKDEVVPSYMTDLLREQCNKHHIRNYLFELPNGRHNDVHVSNPESYFAQLREFFGQCENK